jgi:hypothetical protein
MKNDHVLTSIYERSSVFIILTLFFQLLNA